MKGVSILKRKWQCALLKHETILEVDEELYALPATLCSSKAEQLVKPLHTTVGEPGAFVIQTLWVP